MGSDILIIDCAYPPAVYPTSWQGKPIKGCCVYVGGDTPHVWTPAEIARMMAVPGYEYIVPVFTRDNPTGAQEGVLDGVTASNWSLAHMQPRGTYFMVDMESAVNSPYDQSFNDTVKSRAGLLTMLYGQKSTVLKNVRTSGGYNVADWNFVDAVPTDADADQFADYPLYDVSGFKNPNLLWNFRKPIATPTAPQTPQEEDMLIVVADLDAAGSDKGIFLKDGATYVHVTEDDWPSLKETGAKIWTVGFQQHLNLVKAAGAGAVVEDVPLPSK